MTSSSNFMTQGFRVIHRKTIVTKVQSNVNGDEKLEWPLCYISNIGCVAHNLCNVPSENNSACKSALKM